MAKQIQEILIDDLDGGQANETVAFALDGTSYEIDLSGENAKKLRDALELFVANARKVASEKRRSRRGKAVLTREKAAEIREWARRQGLNVSERGRIASTVVEQYEAAH
ncbi:iron-regulated nucleoid-associated protein Lsr2 [Streptosporangium fragile]|uniref:Iron-regulated nucleoid-associated protein Lsr2 n=1 Tax=Streptosporangium fragile TaxID=46186 RepID=A0ABP6IHA8_9ACTN